VQEENARLSQATTDILKIRADVTRLRRDAAASARASQRVTPVQEAPASADLIATNAPAMPYSASVRVNVPWNQTMVTGGWKLSSGNRAVVLVTPLRGDDATQLEIDSRVVELSEEAARNLGLAQLNTDDKAVTSWSVLDAHQYVALLKAAESSDTIRMAAARMTTRSGSQAQMQLGGIKASPSGEVYPAGPVLDFMPTISADGKSVELEMVAGLDDSALGHGR